MTDALLELLPLSNFLTPADYSTPLDVRLDDTAISTLLAPTDLETDRAHEDGAEDEVDDNETFEVGQRGDEFLVRRGERLYVITPCLQFPGMLMIPFGAQVTVLGPAVTAFAGWQPDSAAGESMADGLAVKLSPGAEAFADELKLSVGGKRLHTDTQSPVNLLRTHVGRSAPPPLDGGYALGEEVYYALPSVLCERQDERIECGQRGLVMGPALCFAPGVAVQFSSFEVGDYVACMLEEISRTQPSLQRPSGAPMTVRDRLRAKVAGRRAGPVVSQEAAPAHAATQELANAAMDSLLAEEEAKEGAASKTLSKKSEKKARQRARAAVGAAATEEGMSSSAQAQSEVHVAATTKAVVEAVVPGPAALPPAATLTQLPAGTQPAASGRSKRGRGGTRGRSGRGRGTGMVIQLSADPTDGTPPPPSMVDSVLANDCQTDLVATALEVLAVRVEESALLEVEEAEEAERTVREAKQADADEVAPAEDVRPTNEKQRGLKPPSDPPDAFVCPITQELMDDPVMAFDGHTYERRAIESWLKRRHTSPKTGEELTTAVLLPNHAIRGQIVEWREQH